MGRKTRREHANQAANSDTNKRTVSTGEGGRDWREDKQGKDGETPGDRERAAFGEGTRNIKLNIDAVL